MWKESCKEEWSCKAQQTVLSLPIDGFPGRTCSRPNVLGTQSKLYQIFLLTQPAHTISSHIFSNIFLWFNYFNHFLMSWELNQTCIKYFLRHNPPTQYLVILSNVFLVSDFLCPGDFIKHIKQKIDYKAFGSKMVILISSQEISESYVNTRTATYTRHISVATSAELYTPTGTKGLVWSTYHQMSGTHWTRWVPVITQIKTGFMHISSSLQNQNQHTFVNPKMIPDIGHLKTIFNPLESRFPPPSLLFWLILSWLWT